MVMARRQINVMYWNARSIRNKMNEVYNFMNEHNIDVAAIQETNLKDEMNIVSNSRYRIIRLDRQINDLNLNNNNNIGGGVLFIIKKDINFELVPYIETEIIEALAIKLRLVNVECTLVSTYYPGMKVLSDLIKYKKDLLKLFSIGGPYVLVGDFNSRHTFWKCSQSNMPGRVLYDLMLSNPIQVVFPSQHTFFPSNYPTRNSSMLDLVITNGLIPLSTLHTSDELPSDHRAVFFKLNEDVVIRDNPYMMYDYENANWLAFQTILNNKINLNEYNPGNLLSHDQIDKAIEFLTDSIHEAERQAVPVKTITRQDFTLSFDTKMMISRRNSLLRNFRRTGNYVLKPEINSLTKNIKNEIQKQVNENYSRTLAKINQNDQMHTKLWKLTKNLRRKNSQIPILKTMNGKAITDEEKAEILSEQVEQAHLLTHEPNRNKKIDKDAKRNARQLTSLQAEIPENKFVTVRELKELLRTLKNKKAPGHDAVKNLLLKRLSNKALILLTHIFNACLKLSYFPDIWKKAIVLAFKKPGKDSTDPKNYRPISLLSTMGKLLEKCIMARMKYFMEEHSILNDEQFGFRSGHSCSHQVIRIKNYIQTGLRKKRSVGMLTLDCERAFDTVWHDGLVLKLSQMNFPVYIVKIIMSYLENRIFQVKVNSTLSRSKGIKAGVPQGGILSPILYTLFVCDIPKPRDCFIGQFADDTVLLTTAYRGKTVEKRLKKGHHSLLRYFVKWRIKLNIGKYEACYFTKRKKSVYKPTSDGIVIEGNNIRWKSVVKYLGVYIDDKLTFQHHIQEAINKAERTIKILYSLICRKSKLCLKNKILLYKTVFRPVLTYAAPVWRSCAMTHRKRLQVTQNKILKLMLGVPFYTSTSTVHELANVKLIEECLDSLVTNFFSRISLVSNPEVQELLD